LRILLSIGPTETAHFQTWHDKAGSVLTLTDVERVTGSKVHFRELADITSESLESNLIMPEPCPFLSRKFQPGSIIWPTNTKGAAMGAVQGPPMTDFSSDNRKISLPQAQSWRRLPTRPNAASDFT
jgi:hypothetical protein